MITGAHAIIYSEDADADRAFLRDTIGFTGIDSGGGWLIFGLPPAEVAVHPADRNGKHELYFQCEDINAFIAAMRSKGVECSDIHKEPWGLLVAITLPGGGQLGVYEPHHPMPGRAET